MDLATVLADASTGKANALTQGAPSIAVDYDKVIADVTALMGPQKPTWVQSANRYTNTTTTAQDGTIGVICCDGKLAPYKNQNSTLYDRFRDRFVSWSWPGEVTYLSPSDLKFRQLIKPVGGTGVYLHNSAFQHDTINDKYVFGVSSSTRSPFYVGGKAVPCIIDPTAASPNWASHTPFTGVCAGSESVMELDVPSKRFVVYGGFMPALLLNVYTWSVDGGLAHQMTQMSIPVPSDFGATTTAKYAGWRTGRDTRRNRLLTMRDNGSLWSLPMDLSSGFTSITATGDMPDPNSRVIYHAPIDSLVAWCGVAQILSPMTPVKRELCIMSLADGQYRWVRVQSAAGGDVVPDATPMGTLDILSDSIGNRLFLDISFNSSDPRLWVGSFNSGSGGGTGPGTEPPPAPNPPSMTNVAAQPSSFAAGGGTVTLDGIVKNGTLTVDGVAAKFPWSVPITATHTFHCVVTGDPAATPSSVSMDIVVSVALPAPPPPPGEAIPYKGILRPLFKLPADPYAPWAVGSKHTIACQSLTDENKLLVFYGDFGAVGSANDTGWEYALDGSSHRQVVNGPHWPDIPAPYGLQDGFGFERAPSRGKYLIWPGSFYPYGDPASPQRQWARGHWWMSQDFKFEQDITFFSDYLHDNGAGGMTPAPNDTTGCLFGGVFDSLNEHIIAFGDSSSGGTCARRWDVNKLTYTSIPFTLPLQPGQTAYFRRGKPVLIGRDVYALGLLKDRTGATISAVFLSWNLDTHTVRLLPPPPVLDPTILRDLEMRPGVSRGKLVWPEVNGPEGGEDHGVTSVIKHIYVFDPALPDRWYVDTQSPAVGITYIGNSVVNVKTSTLDGIVFCSGAFGPKPTHALYYEAP